MWWIFSFFACFFMDGRIFFWVMDVRFTRCALELVWECFLHQNFALNLILKEFLTSWPPLIIKIWKNPYFCCFQSNTSLTAPLNLCPIYSRFFAQVAKYFDYCSSHFHSHHTTITALGSFTVTQKVPVLPRKDELNFNDSRQLRKTQDCSGLFRTAQDSSRPLQDHSESP